MANNVEQTIDKTPGEIFIPRDTDKDRAVAILDNIKSKFLYNASTKNVMVYNGIKWEIDVDAVTLNGEIERYADTFKDIDDKLAQITYKRLNNVNTRNNAITMIKGKRTTIEENYDTNDNLINTNNCIVDINTLNTINHDSSYLITKSANCSYNANINPKNSLFDKFINDIMCNNADDIKALRCLLGYILTTDNKQVMPILWGEGANGKSVLIGVLQNIFADYSCTIDVKVLLDNSNNFDTGENANPQLIKIKGTKLVFVGENKSKKRFDEQLIKTIVSGIEPISARRLRENTIEFIPMCKLIMFTNKLPFFDSTDDGMSRRLIVYPFLRKFEEHEKDIQLIDKLLDDKDTIFSYLIECVKEYRKYGLYKSKNVIEATNKYNAENDIIQQFIDECCITGVEKVMVRPKPLYLAYKKWCDESGCIPLKKQNLLEQLKSKGYVIKPYNGYPCVRCLGLIDNGYDMATGKYEYK